MAKDTKEKKKGGAGKVILTVIMSLLVLAVATCAIVYVAVAHYYTDHFFKGTVINGFDCSNKTVDEVKQKIEAEIMTYALNIHERGDMTERVLADQIGMSYADDGSVDALMEAQDPYKWVYHVKSDARTTVSAAFDYDEALVDEVVESLNAVQSYTEPSDAYLDKDETSYFIVPEVEGTKLDVAKVVESVNHAIENGMTDINLDQNDCYIQPSVRGDNEELNTIASAANSLLKAKITYNFGGGDRDVKIDAKLIMDWLVEKDDHTFSLNKDKIFEFVKMKMARVYDTFGLTHTFKTHDGETITLEGGDYGWCINRDKTTEQLIKAIKSGEEQTLDPIYKYSATDRGANDIGGTYVEVSLKDQHVWCYKDGKVVVDSDVVTGDPTKGNETPSGSVWAINGMEKDATLGTMATQGYSSKVAYWMPFTGNVGLHDAPWRSEFGGEIYQGNGSHGCVNCPPETAKTIFKTVKRGTAVIVY